jgi:hypothetical protein
MHKLYGISSFWKYQSNYSVKRIIAVVQISRLLCLLDDLLSSDSYNSTYYFHCSEHGLDMDQLETLWEGPFSLLWC